MTRWAILTGEYPPQPGGVSDYTRLVARGLAAAGDEVRVYAPPCPRGADVRDPGVNVYRLPGRFGPRSLRILDRSLTAEAPPDRILVQYVPHAFGYKAMNLPFAWWLAARCRGRPPVWVMFHEVAFPFRWRPPAHALLGGVTRVMARRVAGAADRVFVSVPAWAGVLKRVCPRARPAEWLPVPCTLDLDSSPAAVAAARVRYAPPGGGPLVGHFGTFGRLVSELLGPAVTGFLGRIPGARVLFLGRGSERAAAGFGDERVVAAGELPGSSVSAHLRACDLLMQPFPDGVSSRRTSVMAGLANGVPVVTNLGTLSEDVWTGGAVAAAPGPDPAALAALAADLAASPTSRAELGRRGEELYRDLFAPERTIDRLRGKG